MWLDNEGSPEELRSAVETLWRDRLVPFEENVRRGIREPAVRTPRRPAGPGLGGRGPAAAGPHPTCGRAAAVTLDHIGSTAVPGLPAKDVIDLQVGVRGLEDADAPSWLAAMAAAGFPVVEGNVDDSPKDGTVWPKRFHGSADPGRVAHIHVREVDSPGWRWALLFRDWLRAMPAEAQAYAVHKAELAARHATTEAYAEAKEPWFEAAHDRVEAWARQAGWSPTAD